MLGVKRNIIPSHVLPEAEGQLTVPSCPRTSMLSRKRKLLATAAVVSAAIAATVVYAQVPPDHAVVVCQSASFYANYDSAKGPTGLKRVLPVGDKVGHTRNAHPVYNGWAASFDYGPNDWGYMRYECIGGYGSW